MRTTNKKWLIVLFVAMLIIASFPTFGRDTVVSPPQLTIRFAPSPGSFEDGVSGIRTGVFGFRVDEFPDPIPPAGYMFIGWFSDGIQLQAPIAAVRSTTVLAGYAPVINSTTAPSFAVVYNLEPGEGELPQGMPPIQSFTYGSVLTSLPVPTKEGYYFAGWQFYGDTITAPYIVRSDMVLEAVWSPTPLQQSSRPAAIPENQFVTAFNPFPGAFSGHETGIRFGRLASTMDDLPTEPIRQGFTFRGWQLPDGDILADSLVIRSDINLIAVWDESTGAGMADAALLPSASLDTRPNPRTSPTTISLMIFGAVILLGIAVACIYKLNMRQTAAEGRYRAYITRCVREMTIVIRNRSK